MSRSFGNDAANTGVPCQDRYDMMKILLCSRPTSMLNGIYERLYLSRDVHIYTYTCIYIPFNRRDGIITGLGLQKKDRCSIPTAFEQDGTTAAVIQSLGFCGLTRTTAQSCLFFQKTMVSKDLFLPGSPRAVCCIRYSFFSLMVQNCQPTVFLLFCF